MGFLSVVYYSYMGIFKSPKQPELRATPFSCLFPHPCRFKLYFPALTTYYWSASSCPWTPNRRLNRSVSGAHFANAAAPSEVPNISSMDRVRLAFSDHNKVLGGFAFAHPKRWSGTRYFPQRYHQSYSSSWENLWW